MLLPDGFPWMAGTDEFDAMLQRSYGWNLAVAFVPEARPATAADLREWPELAAIARADCFLQNMDRTAGNPNLLVAAGRIVAIDYDACLYLSRALGPSRPPPDALPPGHLLAGLPLPLAPAPALDLPALVAPAPDPWIAAAGVERAVLVQAARRELRRLGGRLKARLPPLRAGVAAGKLRTLRRLGNRRRRRDVPCDASQAPPGPTHE